MHYKISSVDDLSQVAQDIVELTKKVKIVAFFGPMGAGKTTLIKKICHLFGVKDEVNSPTFALVNEYKDADSKPIYHFDFYRIKKLEEVFDIGYEDYFYSGHICLLEWPQMIENLMPDEFVKVEIALGEKETERLIDIDIKN
ncbi:MAG: tRNA (adenosine(37)-N6)-threonylcarbamoyltransferase complex ATPase subunit type 1 TsaE [Bacteroidales bacterium]|nr:tRNA (adenosine(37)-N6)-threonylcarbamoyltransferase complex ATPase subunit type 1 TsaE [Bacteroidales bacterium]